MEPLKINQQVLTWLCIFPANETTSKRKKLAYIGLALTTVVSMSIITLGSMVFFVKYVLTDLESALYALFQIFDCGGFLYACLVFYLSRHRIPSIFVNLAEIYRSNEREEDTYQFLVQTNNRCERMWRSYLKSLVIAFLCATLILIASILLCLFMHGQFDVDYVPPMILIVLPWDQTTLTGYVAKYMLSSVVAQTYLLANGAFLLLFISICWHYQTFLKMFRHFVERLNRPNVHPNDEELLKRLVQFHISVKDYFMHTADIYSPYIMIHLISNMLVLACVVFQLDMELKHVSFNISVILAIITASITNLFIYCYFGMRATESFDNMNDSLGEMNWYRFPVRLQKHLIIIAADMQLPLFYHGFGLILLNLETFTSLIRAVSSYYMMFKTFTSE